MPPRRRHVVRGSRAELAVAHYLANADHYAAGVTRQAEREAVYFLATGMPGNGIGAGWAQLKSDGTTARLRAYRVRLWELAKSGTYDGPTDLQRLRPDGSWEPLRLPDDRS